MYTPVAKRNTPARTGYVPVAQRQSVPTAKERKPVETETPFATTKLGIAKNTILGLPKAALDTAKSVGQGIARGYAATGQRAAKAIKLVEGDTVDPRTFFGASPTAQKIGTSVFGKDKPFSAKTEDIEFLQSFGIDPEIGAKTGGSLTILLSALDLTGAGGGAKGLAGLSKTLRAAKTAEEAAEAMRAVRFADDIVADYAPIFAKAKTTQEVKVALDAAMKLSDTTKAAGYVPVAERVGVVDDASPLLTEARKYKSAEELLDVAKVSKKGSPSRYELAFRDTKDLKRGEFGGLNEETVDAYKSAIERGDRVAPILVSEDGGLFDGHHRLQAYKEMGIEEVPVLIDRGSGGRNFTNSELINSDIWKKAQSGDVLRAEAKAQGLPELPKVKAKINPRTELIETGKKPELQFQHLDDLARQMRHPELTEQRLEGISLELARLEDVANEMPGKQLQRFKSRKEGQFLDLKDPTKAKTEAQRRALLAREDKVLKASESAFEGTPLADRYDDPDTIRGAIDEYTSTKNRIRELRTTATEIRAERSAIRKGERLMQLTKGNRRMAYRAVRNAFDLTESDLMKIRRGRDIMAMEESEFNAFIGEAEQIAERLNKTRQSRVSLEATVYEKELRKWENVSEAMGFPQLSKMTPEQMDTLNEILSQYKTGDEFLTTRQLETIDRTPLTGMRTIREVNDHLAKTHGLTAGELPPIKAHPWMYDTQLARQHPLYDLLVDRYNESYLRANGTIIELEREVGDLVKAARKSRPQTVGNKIAPTDSQIVQWLESDQFARSSLEAKMTGAEIKAAKRMDQVFKGYYDWLSKRALDKKFSSRFEDKYFPHVRRGFLESWKEDGFLKAVKEQFDQFKQEERLLTILDEKTGDVLPYEKWVGFSQFRTDNLVPTKNAAQAFNSYVTALEKARQWDGFIPEIMVYVHSLSPRTMTKRGIELDDSVKRFVKEWVNSKKGRVAKQIVKPGGKVDWALRTGVALTRIRDLGLNIPVGIANIFGEQAGNLTMLGAKNFATGASRLASKQGRAITSKYANFVGKTFWEKLTEASNTAGDQLLNGIYGLFGAASRRGNQVFLLGNLTDEEFKTGTVSIERLAELRKAMGKYRVVEGSESIFGKTAEGTVGGQYKKWAIPILVSTVDNGKRLAKIITTKGIREALSSPEGSELFYSFLISATIGLGTMGYYNELKDDKDRNFVEDVMYKSIRDSLSMIGAMDPQFIGSFAAPRLASFVIDLTESISQLIRLEENKEGELTGANSLQRTLTPTLVKSLFAEEEKKSTGSGGFPELPALPKLPQLPKLPKLPSL